MSALVAGKSGKALGLVLLLAVVFAGTLSIGSGKIPLLRGSDGGGHGVLKAGNFAFNYPAGWNKMSHEQLPKQAVRGSVPGAVVAGLCTAGAKGAGCTASVDVSYVLFQEGQAFPALPVLEGSLDVALAKQFAGFRKDEAQLRRTTEGMQYLTYEFSYKKAGVRRHQLVAAYKNQGKGLLVVATGPSQVFAEQRATLQQMLDEASATEGEATAAH